MLGAMKCAVCNVGTRGDLQPLIALGLGLQKKGHLDEDIMPRIVLNGSDADASALLLVMTRIDEGDDHNDGS